MAQSESETAGGTLDLRLTAVEQILPTLARKEDLRTAIEKAVAPLPTREEMRSAIEQAVAPLATRDELHRALRDEGAQTRRHFDVVAGSLRGDIRLLAEGQVMRQQRVEDLRIEIKGDIAKLDRRVMRLEMARG
jgi:crotonobetainyl-CoA:carnitine CoA-transferase CaiB-like acyl-CoA transferase